MLSLQFKNLSSVTNRLSSSLSTLSLRSLSSTRRLMEGTMLETKSKSESKSKLTSFSRLNSSASLLFHHSFSSIPLLCDETLPESGPRPKSLHPKDKAYLAAVIPKRIRMFESIKAKQMEEQSRIGGEAIKITSQDGVVREGKKWITTPMDVAQEMAKSLASTSLISQVNGVLWDMFRPLEFDCELKFFTFDSDEGRDTFWHSSAHILGQSLEMEYGCKLCIGPCTTRGEGFYYDAFYGELGLNEDQLRQIESGAIKAVAEKQPFERIEVSREQAMELFSENKFKVELIKDLQENTTITVYRCGPLVDLCRGPHIPNTSFVKAFACLKTSSAYWRGNKDRESLQRVSGISYPDSKHLKEYLTQLEEAMKYDHRKLGLNQKLFFFHPLSPGSPFFLKHGTRVYNRLIDFVKSQYKERGYHEVMSPNIYNMKLWETSGHAANYKENMFTMQIENEEFGLKPMNCPGHCLLFDCRGRSYSELPLRLADFGVLHRNEASGALSGLTRVRRFQQDDAHIFCREYQIKDEVRGVLDFIKYVYDVFGFTFELDLSTRPKNYMGDIETWDKAEAALSEALDELGIPWKINEGDGAFYGPKIDIGIFDALKRKFQCATVQLDFQLPQPFDLSYSTEDEAKRERPVLIHRAILGSVERMLAILLEHYKGKWPFWLSPRQAIVCPVSVKSQAYALKVRDQIDHSGFFVEIDTTDRKINKKVREAQLAQYNYILVVGEKEEEQGQVSVRERDKGDHSVMSIEELLKLFKEEVAASLKVSSAYAKGNKKPESLHRIYGISYPYSKRLKEYLTQLEEANIYDHRQLGLKQELFFFDPLSPGSAFFLPHGTLIFNKLMDFIRTQCKKRGYDEVSSPNIYNMKLWETSGHVANYNANMFTFPIDNEEFGIKPRNCPGHCLVFANEARSYRELPLRLVDFGVLHQNEACSELTELTRVWRFQQDDGVIFCRESQVKDEVRGVLNFIEYAYDVFGLTFELELSIRPKEYKGNIETWDKAEAALREALDEFGRPWKIIDGGGSVNGPRIDIGVLDALKRKFKCGALELDFQLPQQFNLSYSGEDETKRERPVIIHRTIIGSFERMFAILLEHYKGKWPFWLSPRQTIVSPVSEKFQEYALQVCDQIHDTGFRVALDAMDGKINKEEREEQLAQYNYILVVGEDEAKHGQVTVHNRDKGDHTVMSIEALLEHFKEEEATFH